MYLPDKDLLHLLDGPPEVRKKQQIEITEELTRKYGSCAADEAIFVHFITTKEILEVHHEQAER